MKIRLRNKNLHLINNVSQNVSQRKLVKSRLLEQCLTLLHILLNYICIIENYLLEQAKIFYKNILVYMLKKCKNVRPLGKSRLRKDFYVRHMQVLCKTVLHF